MTKHAEYIAKCAKSKSGGFPRRDFQDHYNDWALAAKLPGGRVVS